MTTATAYIPLAASGTRQRGVARQDLLVGAALAAAGAALTFDGWLSILQMGFHKEELSYVLLAPVTIAWIAWVRRAQLAACTVRGQWVGIAVLIGGWLVYSYGYLTDPVLWRAGAVLTAVGALLAGVGSDVLRRFLPAFAATAFLIPISPNGRYKLAGPPQDMTAQATQ